MYASPCDPSRAQSTLAAIRREWSNYAMKKPGRLPPADSPSRPELARLWAFASSAAMHRPRAPTFDYCGHKFAVVYVAGGLCAMDLANHCVLVKQPSSMMTLHRILNSPVY